MTTPVEVFEYYASFNAQVLPESCSCFPCDTEDTTFRTIKNLKMLIEYLTEKKDGIVQHVKSPLGIPLLLTAYGNMRVYAEHDKVIVSGFSALFPHSLKRFLHPDLIDLHLTNHYFVHAAACSYENIEGILSDALPNEMMQCCVGDFQKIIKVDDLKEYWKCFCTDPVFLQCLPEIIQRWALLPSSTGQLFSGKSELRPIIEDEQIAVGSVLKSVGMPFLQQWACNEYIRAQKLTCCPKITNHSDILLCLQIFHKENHISFSSDNLEILLEYLSKVNYKSEPKCKEALKSLPLFQTIDGILVSIRNAETFLLPTNICRSGHEKWFVKSNMTFLDRKGLWYKYLSPTDADVSEIAPEQIYCQYIFPKFSLLSEDERYEQLKYIRDNTFKECSFNFHLSHSSTAHQFLETFKALRCLGEGNAALKCISEYYDHTLKICTLFKKSFCFVPQRYQDEIGLYNWLEFFRQNGLQTSISKEQFVDLCTQVAGGHNNSNVRTASKCLLKYLFEQNRREWCNSAFINRVTSIPFVCMETLSKLAWIKPVCAPTNITTTSNETIFMTKLYGACLDVHGISYLVWTVKPLVSLPAPIPDGLVGTLGVNTTVQIEDIIQNITCIAEGHLSNPSHFDRLSDNCTTPKGAESLIAVMSAIFNHIQVTFLPAQKDRLKSLHSIPCIPVNRVFKEETVDKNISILVKPCQVVSSDSAKHFYPFLHQLPNDLYPYMDLLAFIGVKKGVDAFHMKLVLEMVYLASNNQELDVNTKKIVMAAITCLHKILKEQSTADHSSLNPLYLPDNTNRLCKSTTLVYRDDLQYTDVVLDFSDTGLSEVLIPSEHSSYLKRNDTLDFCSVLPESVRPKQLSSCTTMKIHSEPVEEQPPQAVELQKALKRPRVFRAISAIVKHTTSNEALAKNCYECLVTIAAKVEVVTVQSLHYDIIATSSQKVIGRLTVKHAFDVKNCKLYVEPASATKTHFDKVVSVLSRWLMSNVDSILNNNSKSLSHDEREKLSIFLLNLLKMPSDEDIVEAFKEEYHFDLDDNDETDEEADVQTRRLGQSIPLCWHHRLDQDIHNIFTYQEWVGYEKEEGRIVFAQVIHRVVQDCDDPYKTKYVIRTAEDDMNGTEVSALNLYKFLRGEKIPDMELSDSQEVVVREARGSDPNGAPNDADPNAAAANTARSENLQDILKQICYDLREIWQLPEEDRRKAVKRLYLKWHPDKNLHQVQLADQVFKFLKRQVDRLAAGLSLEDPTQSTSESTTPRSQPSHSPFWQSYYSHWEETAHYHQRSWYSERRRRRRNRGRGYSSGGGGGGGGGGFWSQPTWQPTPDRAEGRRWLQQAEADLEVLQVLHSATPTTGSACSYVCFMAYEVISKVLKGGLYFKCGLSSGDRMQRNVVQLAHTLEAEVMPLRGKLALNAGVVKDYEETTRFPHLCPGESVPARHFGPEQATEARRCAMAVLSAVKEVVEL